LSNLAGTSAAAAEATSVYEVFFRTTKYPTEDEFKTSGLKGTFDDACEKVRQRRSTFSRAVINAVEDLKIVSGLSDTALWEEKLDAYDGWWNYVSWKGGVETVSDEAYARVMAFRHLDEKKKLVDSKAIASRYVIKKAKLIREKFEVTYSPEIPTDL